MRRLAGVEREVFWLVLLLCAAIQASSGAEKVAVRSPLAREGAVKELPLPGEAFLFDGRQAFIIAADTQQKPGVSPWVWYAPTLPGLPGKEERWMFEHFLAAGISVAGIDVGESYGSPAGRALYSGFYNEMLRRGYSARPVLLGRSRGGLMTLGWAAENPEKVGGFAGIYPVCNVASYPGIAKAAPAYGMTVEELQTHLEEQNPIERLGDLARAHVPMFAIHGDADTVVPLGENSGLMRDRYLALGGSMQLMVPPGQGHNMWAGFFESKELVDFVRDHAGPNIVLTSPRDYQVVQRRSVAKGRLLITGKTVGIAARNLKIEGRLNGVAPKWRRIKLRELHESRELQQLHGGEQMFAADWAVPAGGWYRFEVRAVAGEEVLAETVVEHVGIGEVFVVAGQSNSANHGAEKQTMKSGLVAAFDADGLGWQVANDPQPGASGAGGSFMPPFGDAMAERFHVPVGIVACGLGATSVREWLPAGSRFPNPPTLTNHVQQLANGEWESRGDIFSKFTERMKELGPHGFRTVLWHQGESDANQADATRTLSGELYVKYVKQLIKESRKEIGWKAPWFVAQASYHTPRDAGSPEIRAAQASLWRDGTALEGPDSDALQGDFRDEGGKGVHFSGAGLREHAHRWFEKVAPWLEK